MILKWLWIVLISSFAQAYLPDSGVGKQNELPEAIEGVGIEEMLDTQLPSDLSFVNEQGETVTLGKYFNDRKPVILSLVYYNCPSLCNLHLKGVFDVFQDLNLTPGEDFEFVAVTIDPDEDADLALSKKENYISEYLADMENPGKGIHFLTGSQENITKIAKLVGFEYKWSEEMNEWAHASAAIISTPQGVVSRYLHGVYFEPQTFRLSLVEASKGLIGDFTDNFALFCFRYDPKTNKYSFYIMNILRGFAAFVLLLLLAWLVPFWMRARKANG